MNDKKTFLTHSNCQHKGDDSFKPLLDFYEIKDKFQFPDFNHYRI